MSPVCRRPGHLPDEPGRRNNVQAGSSEPDASAGTFRCVGTVIIADVSLYTLHPDLRLGLLLVVAAVLLDAGYLGTRWAAASPAWPAFTSAQYVLLHVAGSLAALFVVAAAIWVDRRPPHRMMAEGAGVLALGLFLAALPGGFGSAISGMFLAWAGGAFVGSLVFFAVAVKGATRFRGALIGALGLVSNVDLGVGLDPWASVTPTIVWIVGPVLAGGILLLVLLPRWFTGHYGPGPTLRETLDVPGAKLNIAWVAGVYLVAAMIMTLGTPQLRLVPHGLVRDVAMVESEYQFVALAGGIGALLWGMASDFLPVRRLLIALAVVSLLAALSLWLPGGDGTDMLILALVRGGLISLPWVLMAESLSARHFAKLFLAVTWVGWLGSSLGVLYWSWAHYVWGLDAVVWIVLVEMAALVAVVTFRPRLPETVGNQPKQ